MNTLELDQMNYNSKIRVVKSAVEDIRCAWFNGNYVDADHSVTFLTFKNELGTFTIRAIISPVYQSKVSLRERVYWDITPNEPGDGKPLIDFLASLVTARNRRFAGVSFLVGWLSSVDIRRSNFIPYFKQAISNPVFVIDENNNPTADNKSINVYGKNTVNFDTMRFMIERGSNNPNIVILTVADSKAKSLLMATKKFTNINHADNFTRLLINSAIRGFPHILYTFNLFHGFKGFSVK